MAFTNADTRSASPQADLTRVLADTIVRFERDNFHRTARRVRVHLVDDLILLRLQGVLSPAERNLAESREGQMLMRQLLVREFEEVHELLVLRLNEVLPGRRVRGVSVDLDPAADERLIVCRLDGPIDSLTGTEDATWETGTHEAL
ncbi:MAG: hypothetical protein BAA04_00215 [Firmicutes bacterium ZCTH02-B6]|nr:MAG: hypothetical protein BAA04_00215 [Firmicutes bacterium ZCTH02-B6]